MPLVIYEYFILYICYVLYIDLFIKVYSFTISVCLSYLFYNDLWVCFLELEYVHAVYHYTDVIMGTIASQIATLTIVYPSVYSGADQRKHQNSESLAFVRGIHRGPVNSPHKWPVTRKMFPFDYVIMKLSDFKQSFRTLTLTMGSFQYIKTPANFFTNIGISMMKMRQSQDCLIFILKSHIWERWY